MTATTPFNPRSLAERFHQACRTLGDRKIGLEIERIGLFKDGSPLTYAPHGGRLGAGTLLERIATRFQWKVNPGPDGRPLSLSGTLGKVSLEPGSQLELAAYPGPSLLQLAETIDDFENQVDEVSHPEGLQWICIGVNPIHPVNAIDVIPSPRYHIMTDYLGKSGTLGTSMMRLTSSVQINLDYTSEAEAIEMLRTALAAAPLSYVLFGNSPFSAGKESGWLSYRQEIWRRTDPVRTGLVPEAFAPDFSFQKYAELAWNRPLMFVQDAEGAYAPGQGMSLADIGAGKLPGIALSEANLTNSVQQLFFEARLKPGYIEIRSLDGQCPGDRYAATAFWTGVLYQPETRRRVLDTLGKLTPEARDRLFEAAGKYGMDTQGEGISLKTLAHELAELARQTLRDRGLGEQNFLAPVFASIERGKNPAQRRLATYLKKGRPTDPAALVEIAGKG